MFSLRYIALLLSFFSIAGAGSALAQTNDFRLSTVQGRDLRIDARDFFLASADLMTAVPVIAPEHGTLVRKANGRKWVYSPSLLYFGSDVFQLSVEDSNGELLSASFEVWITPRLMPISGRWDDGMHDSLGYYDTLQKEFMLCDGSFSSDGEILCRRVKVKKAKKGWIPMAGNWGADDGLDRFYLFDPKSGDVHRLAFKVSGRLKIEQTVRFAAAGTWPALGDWDGDGQDTIVFLDPSGSFLSWPDNDPSSNPIVTELRLALPSVGVPWPVAWSVGGQDAVGIVDSHLEVLDWMTLTQPSLFGQMIKLHSPPDSIPAVGDWHPDFDFPPLLHFNYRLDGSEPVAFISPEELNRPTALPVKFVTDPGG